MFIVLELQSKHAVQCINQLEMFSYRNNKQTLCNYFRFFPLFNRRTAMFVHWFVFFFDEKFDTIN